MRFLPLRIATAILLSSVASSVLAAERITDLRQTVIVISIDGFRADYLEKMDIPNLRFLAARGVRAKYMIPVFPTKTFPNHYTLMTGLYPAHHGIVANTMYDPNMNAHFKIADRTAVDDARWWGGEPIWVTAETQNVKTAPLLWPGALAKIKGIEPSYNMKWRERIPTAERIGKVVGLLDLPTAERPQLLTLYFEMVDKAGHETGPWSEETRTAVQEADQAIGQLLSALRERGIEDQVNLIVVSDHGMSKVSPKKVVFLDNYLDPESVEIVDGSPVMALRPKDGNVATLYEKVRRIPHAKAYTSSTMPQRWHYTGNNRITPVLLVANDEWTISTRKYLESHPVKGGTHGFDNDLRDMRALFVAAGPSFERGTMKPFANIHIYSLLAYLLNVRPAANDGSIDVFRSVLIQRSESPKRKELAPWQKAWDEVAVLK
jgi:predicted AlkP superfamily pyrophosphatase or phosphodiesterase